MAIKKNPLPSDIGWEKIVKEFVALVLKSPVAIVTLVLSFLFGYGISFIIFDYRRATVCKSHYPFHLLIGLGYAASVFIIVNHDLLKLKSITSDDIASRMPLTLLIAFSISFVVMVTGAIWREVKCKHYIDGE